MISEVLLFVTKIKLKVNTCNIIKNRISFVIDLMDTNIEVYSYRKFINRVGMSCEDTNVKNYYNKYYKPLKHTHGYI